MRGMRKEIPNEGTYNFDGDAERRIQIEELGCRGAFIGALSNDVPRDEVFINGMVVYTINTSRRNPAIQKLGDM